MGFLKNLLIEQEDTQIEPTYEYKEEIEVVDAELAEVDRDNLIEDIYAQNDLGDKTQSIFKVEEIMNTLPKEMATATKQATVKGIMASFGLTEEVVVEDGQHRNEILLSIEKQIKDNCENEIVNTKATIEECKKEIERLEKMIAEAETDMKISEEKIDAECARINKLIDFIVGGE